MIRRILLACGLVCLSAAPAFAQLPFNIPDFCASPTKTATQDGNWNDGATWGGSVPTAGAIVRIPSGIDVTYNQSSTTEYGCVGIASGGLLYFSTSTNTKLMIANLMVYEGGALTIGDPAGACIDAANTAQVIFTDTPLDTGTISPGPVGSDPEQYGTGMIGFGTVRVCGASKSPTWLRLTQEVTASDTTWTVASCPTGWASGDELVIPDSRHQRSHVNSPLQGTHYEDLAYTSCASGTLTVAAPTYDHPGARDMSGTLQRYPHVENLSRNVTFTSENTVGTRGHILFTQRADVDIRYARFTGLGRTTTEILDSTMGTTGFVQGTHESPSTTRGTGPETHIGTNQIGRYPVHFHHLHGPVSPQPNGYQFTFIGNTVDDAPKWGIAVHHSHYGLVQWNTTYNVNGAHIALEDGSETGNVIEYNSMVRGTGTDGWVAAGREGVGLWAHGFNSRIRYNIAAGFFGTADGLASYGFKLYGRYVGTVAIPTAQGVDTTGDANTTATDGNQIPIKQFEGNEVYGSENGLTWWWLCAADYTAYESCGAGETNVVKDLISWAIVNRVIYAYGSNNVLVDGWRYYGDTPATQLGEGSGFYAGDYMQRSLTIRNGNIQGARVGFYGTTYTDEPLSTGGVGTPQTIEDTYVNNLIDFRIATLYGSGTGAGVNIPPRHTYIRRVTFGGSGTHILMAEQLGGAFTTLRTVDAVHVENYNLTGANFQVYYTEQAPTALFQQSVYYDPPTNSIFTTWASPVSGLTNAENWSTYGIAYAGAVAPCTDTMANITGIACDTSAGGTRMRLRRRGVEF